MTIFPIEQQSMPIKIGRQRRRKNVLSVKNVGLVFDELVASRRLPVLSLERNQHSAPKKTTTAGQIELRGV